MTMTMMVMTYVRGIDVMTLVMYGLTFELSDLDDGGRLSSVMVGS